MIKKSASLLLTFAIFISILAVQTVHGEELDLTPNAQSAILIEQDTGTVIYEKNSHHRLPPASITKVMTLLLIMEAIDSGQIKYDDKVRVSEYAASMGGSQIFLEANEMMSVKELLKGVAMASGNDASVALAEYIAGSEEAFVNLMNKRAEELGLKDTRFVNSNGLPAKNHYTSAYDIAIMSRELLKHEDITKYTGVYQDYLRKNTSNPFWLVNTNKLVRFYQGVDGIKTGYTSEAKFCLTATAKKNQMRVIAVVMGEPTSKTRNKEVSKLLDYAFAQFKTEVLFKKNDIVQSLEVSKGKKDSIPLIAPNQISILMKKSEKFEDFQQVIKAKERIMAPIKKGEVLGELQAVKDGKVIKSFPLVAAEDVNKGNLLDMLKMSTKGFLFKKEISN